MANMSNMAALMADFRFLTEKSFTRQEYLEIIKTVSQPFAVYWQVYSLANPIDQMEPEKLKSLDAPYSRCSGTVISTQYFLRFFQILFTTISL